MAEQRPNQTKRQVKNPETFRERALKAGENTAEPRRKAIAQKAGNGISAALRPFGKFFSGLFATTPFRLLGRALKPVGKILAKLLFLKHLSKSWQELRKVTWPSWRQSWRLTTAVLLFAVIFGVTIAGVDYVVEHAFKKLLLR